jgi:L,D-transpeptidase ErfK/SrfK
VLLAMPLAGCSVGRSLGARLHLGPPPFDEAAFAKRSFRTYRIATPSDGKASDDAIIGDIQTYRIRKGDTLLDVARWYGLGYNEMIEANPGVDDILPPVGAEVTVPTRWILPCCTWRGIVVNIPEMRLYHFSPDPDSPDVTLVRTYPVGLGREGWRTPRGKFTIKTKTVNPRWNIPESIRKEHIRERGDDRKFIEGGAPDNPLGKYRMQLSKPIYGIHGTDIPWGIGMQVTHGCVRLYPEDIAHLFPLTDIGTPVEFIYQPVKVGRSDGEAYVEVHRDIYKYTPSMRKEMHAALARQGLQKSVDARLVENALTATLGVPLRVSPDRRAAAR